MTPAARLRARLDPNHPCNKSFPGVSRPQPDDNRIEEAHQAELLGGYVRYVGRGKARKKNRCDQCFQYRSANGTCSCP